MGQFQPGQMKPLGSGRRKGTLNKRTQILQEALESAGLDIPVQLSQLLPQLDPEKRADVLLELMAYIYPKRKAIEVESTARSAATASTMTPEEAKAEAIRLLKEVASDN